MTRILWVEDQFHWLNKLTPVLQSADFGDGEGGNEVQTFKFAEAACQHIRLAKNAPDIAILDANMNGNDGAGFTVQRALVKKWPQLPIIYLSEHSGTGIEQNALEKVETKDFIAKHQDNIEAVLCWRIKAALRQARMRGAMPQISAEVIQQGDLTIDVATWEVYWHGERLMNPKNSARPLPPIPRKILRCLVERSPRAVSTDQIADYLELDNFNYASYRQHIKTLRDAFEQMAQKLDEPSFLDVCKSNRGIVTVGDEAGYCWKPMST